MLQDKLPTQKARHLGRKKGTGPYALYRRGSPAPDVLHISLRIPLALHVAYMETHQTSVRRALTDIFNA